MTAVIKLRVRPHGYPRAIAPPEDCGGIPGHYTMLEALEDEEHPDHDGMPEWIGGNFDPTALDLDGINRRLRTLP